MQDYKLYNSVITACAVQNELAILLLSYKKSWDCDTESPFSQAKRFAWTKIGFKLPSHTYNDAQAIAAFMCCFAKCFYGSPRFKMQIVVRKAALRSGVIKWNPPKGTKSSLQKIKGAYFLYAIIHIPR